MSDSADATNANQPNLSEADAELIQQLNDNPIVGTQIRLLIKRFGEEVASGMDAHEAEEMAIGQLQQLGKAVLSQWAHSTHEKNLTETLLNDPSLIKSGKKNSGGIPPSESSA